MMKMAIFKRTLAAVLGAAVLLSFAGCNPADSDTTSSGGSGLTIQGREVAATVTDDNGKTTADGSVTYDLSAQYKHIENVRKLGRTYVADYKMLSSDETLSELTHFNWSASGFEFTFRGTGLSVDLVNNRYDQGPMYFYAFVDGEKDIDKATLLKFDDTTKERMTFTLAEGLEDGTHTVELRRASRNVYGNFFDERSLAGKAALVSATVTGGSPELLGKIADKTKKLEFIGDSITCGDAINQIDGQNVEDALRTYAAYTARALDADWNVMSISGNGVIGSVLGGPLLDLPDQYLYTDNMGNGSVEWDFSQYQPDVVIVNLGTNDRACVGPESIVGTGGNNGKFSYDEFMNGVTRKWNENSNEEHHTGVKDFLNMINENNPNAKILWVCGAMGDELNSYIEQAINEWNETKGSTVAYFLGLENDANIENGKAYDNGHPSETASKVYSEAIVAKLNEIMGW